MRNTIQIFFWIFILIVASFLRLWQLDALPAELHRDEASIAYNAYSILVSGHDEHGVSFPFNFRAFGEFKLPGLIYVTVPFIYFLGLSEWAIRLPTALAGILCVPALFWYVRELGYSKKIAYISVVLLTLSFWHISQSRNVYEPMVGLLWSTLAITAWLRAQSRPIWAVPSILFYLLSAVFYNVPWLLIPIVFAAISVHTHAARLFKMKALLGAFAVIVACGIGIGLALQSVNTSRSTTTVFNNQELSTQSRDFLYASLVSGVPSKIARVVEFPYTLQAQTLFQSYLSSFNPVYLLSLGDANSWHNLRNIYMGNLNPVLLLPILAGVVVLIKKWQDPRSKVLGGLLLITPLVSGITVDSPITNRLLDFHLTLIILAAVGTDYIFTLCKTNVQKGLFIIGVSTYLLFFGLFFFRYYYTYNNTLDSAWNPGIKSMFETLKPLEESYETIYIHGWELSYIFQAVFYPVPPTEFVQNAQRYVSGFDQVGQYRNYYFASPPSPRTMDSEYLHDFIHSDQGILIAVAKELNPSYGRVIAQQTKYTGDSLWIIYELTVADLLHFYEQQSKSVENLARIEYLESCQMSCDKSILEPFVSVEKD
jgi:4-amino-4-deoxy-L-arabinose transferase-like glycosyltransferase